MLGTNQAATIAEPIQNNTPELTVTQEAPAQMPAMHEKRPLPEVQSDAEPVVPEHHSSNKTAYEDAAAELNDALNKLYDLPFLSRDEVQNKID